MYKVFIIASGLLAALLFTACKPSLPTDANGLDWHYYPDMMNLFHTDVVKNGRSVKQFIEVTRNANGTKDSAYLLYSQIDWPYYMDALNSINMYHSSYNGLYTMYQDQDTNTKRVKITYEPRFDNLPVKNLIVTMHTQTQDVLSIYGEVQKKGAMSTTKQSVMYRPGEFIQVVTEQDGALVDKPRNARQLYVQLKTSVEISNF
jgi:hypothetical protein